MAKMVLATALAASAATGPTLPTIGEIDHTAEEIRTTLAHQIREHQDYTTHMRKVWRKRRKQSPPPTPTPAPGTGYSPTYQPTYSSDGWGDELASVGFPSSVIPTMLTIIDRESGGDPSAMNASGACGLLQIYPYVAGCLDPMTNLRLGYEKYQAAGLAPWAATAP